MKGRQAKSFSTGVSEAVSDDDSLLSYDQDKSRSTAQGGAKNDEEYSYGGRKAIFGSKIAVYIVLLMAATSLGAITWVKTKGEDVSSFESEVCSKRICAHYLLKV
jgi:hypothetical protein